MYDINASPPAAPVDKSPHRPLFLKARECVGHVNIEPRKYYKIIKRERKRERDPPSSTGGFTDL